MDSLVDMEGLGAELADSLGNGKGARGPRVKYGTVEGVSGSTLDVSLAGGTVTGVCMTVSCAGAAVGDRVVLLVDGPLVTCLGVIATSDNARYVKQGGDSASASRGSFDFLAYKRRKSIGHADANGKGGYDAGATGGEASHKLTASEMPSHTHSVRCAYTNGSSRRDTDVLVYDGWNMEGCMWTSQWSGSAGGSAAHNNMPPYLAVYVWKRTA